MMDTACDGNLFRMDQSAKDRLLEALDSVETERDDALTELVAIKARLDGFLLGASCASCKEVLKHRVKGSEALYEKEVYEHL